MKNILKTIVPASVLILAACQGASSQEAKSESQAALPSQTAEAVFAGGCFWCVEADFEKLPGVIEAVSGYTGGHTIDPTYKQVTRGGTGHYEAAKIIYDPSVVSYDELLEYFWVHVDPTDDGGQFCDRGQSYETAIFANEKQLAAARASKTALQGSGRLKDDVVTPVLKATAFYDAEDYHQNYYLKKPRRYNYYRNGCGRDKKITKVWGSAH